MAELNEQQESPVGERKNPPRSRGGFWFGVTILLLVIGLAGAGFYLFSQLRAKQDDLDGEVKNEMSRQMTAYQSQLTNMGAEIATLQKTIANKDERFSQTVADFTRLHDERLESTRKELTESILKLQRQLGKTRGDWLIADAEYLLSVANDRLYLVGDVNTTRQALEAADQRLRESGDAAAYKVRDQVIKDIAALANVKSADIVGLYSSIQALQARASSLVLLLPHAGKSSDMVAHKTDKVSDGAQESDGLLDSAKSKFSEIVTIKHTDHPIAEILTPEQATFIREQLRIKLEVVKIALVQQNESLYKNSLADAKKWLEEQFEQSINTQAFIAELTRFDSIQIRSQFPDISLSLKMLKDIAKLRVDTDNGMQTNGVSESPISGTSSVTAGTPVDNTIKPNDVVAPQADPVVVEPSQPPLIPAPDNVSAQPPQSAPVVEAVPVPPQGVSPISAPPASVNTAPVVNDPEATSVEQSNEQQPTVEPHDAPKKDVSLGEKLMDQIKQYLPGKN